MASPTETTMGSASGVAAAGHASHSSQAALTMAALGVVFGDIGTSPLYAFKEAFSGAHGLVATQPNIIAALSALLWSVVLIVCIKYVCVVLSYSNNGEGGVLALTALAHRMVDDRSRRSKLIVTAGVFAAALFYGDAIITPAISVLSAVEGMSIATPRFEHFVLPITIGVLVALFLIQSRGSASVGKLFGPVTVLWFVCIGAAGIHSIWQTPEVLKALSPLYALQFAQAHPDKAFFLLSAIFLAMTGAEALYADMGHFGARAVRQGWCWLVFPSLILNYFGQGALIMRQADAISNPFFLLVPDSMLFALVILATMATVIASQATISGAFSMTQQASRLGYLPRIRVLHTSDQEQGQIYIPSVNWFILIAVVALVLAFKSSSALAGAYGIAVSGTMLITTGLVAFVVWQGKRRWRRTILLALLFFALLEMGFFASNLSKLDQGGWFPLTLGALIFIMLTTWRDGSLLVLQNRRAMDVPLADFLQTTPPEVPVVAGTAVYLSADLSLVPTALFHNLKHFKVMHAQTVLLHVSNENVPYIDNAHRLQVNTLAPGLWSIEVRYGFREQPDIPAALDAVRSDPSPLMPNLDPMLTSYFVARVQVVQGQGRFAKWRCGLYAWMARQASGVAAYYKLPANQVVELGTQVAL